MFFSGPEIIKNHFVDEVVFFIIMSIYYQNFQPKPMIGSLSSFETV